MSDVNAGDVAMPVQWLGYCGRCGEPAPEQRDTESEAVQDAHDCPCKEAVSDA